MASGNIELEISPAHMAEFLNVDRFREQSPNHYDVPTIAPWEDEPPTPPPKPMVHQNGGRMFPKASLSSLTSKSSAASLLRTGRPSEPSATASSSRITINQVRASDGASLNSYDASTLWSVHSNDSMATDLGLAPPREIRKTHSTKNLISAMFTSSKREKSRPPVTTPTNGYDPNWQSSLDLPPSPTSTINPNASSSSSIFSRSRARKRSNTGPEHRSGGSLTQGGNRTSRDGEMLAPPVPPLPMGLSAQGIQTLDMTDMEGIINTRALPTYGQGDYGGPSEMGERLGRNGMFSNPFAKTRVYDNGRDSPTTLRSDRGGHTSPLSTLVDPPRASSPWGTGSEFSHSTHEMGLAASNWETPESWAFIDKYGKDALDGAAGESDDEETAKKDRRRTMDPLKLAAQTGKYRVRIYRPNGSYHVVGIHLITNVNDLMLELNKQLRIDNVRDPHRLYLKERGRERQLGPKERPADILRRRLEQAGYELKDNLQEIGNDDWRHLVLFVYKSQKLGVELEDTAGFEGTYDSYEIVNLSGRGLRTLPVLLYGQAEHIVVLNLSQNPMIDLPRDFIQSCGQLRDLKMSNMAIKKVPSSLRHCTPLSRLDLTCNRIRDLEDCGLENLPNLKALTLANNRLEQLPFIFPHLRALQTLNISNNRFRHVPAVVCEMPTLRDLDISFNSISALPEEIGQLVQLQQLVMVGNQVSEFPRECSGLVSLQVLDCRRNLLTDLSPVCQLPKLETLRADHNSIAELTLVLGPRLHILEVSWNDITRLAPPPADSPYSYSLTHLDLSHAKLSSLEESAFRSFTKLENLRLDHNALRTLPDSIGNLRRLMHLSCASNKLDLLPDSIGDLQKLETLDVNSNSIRELPASLWKCASIVSLNATSNLIEIWHEWEGTSSAPTSNGGTAASAQLSPGDADILRARKTSNAGLSMAGGRRERVVPPLGYSLERLYLGENQLGDDIVRLVASCFNELKIINLSFNDIQELPPLFFKQHPHLIELYLSGNKLSTIPSDTFDRAHYLTTLFLNGNRLQTIPAELGKIKTLTSLDVGSNQLKYNINNSEYDWNWGMNPGLRYLNLSGNKRLEIKAKQSNRGTSQDGKSQDGRGSSVANFDSMQYLRVLGLMDVTMGFNDAPPTNTEDRRVRTQEADVNGMTYGIADTIGKAESLSMFDLVAGSFRGRKHETLFMMFGRAQQPGSNSKLAKFLHDNFVPTFRAQLNQCDMSQEGIKHSLRRTFLKLNKTTFEFLRGRYSDRKMSAASVSTSISLRKDDLPAGGASGIVAYVVDKVMYVANVGNALAVVSRGGHAISVSRKHDPWDREETSRIRSAEGWVSVTGQTNDEIDVSRSFGFYRLTPMVNCKPDVHVHELEETDDFLIIANRGLWDYVSFQTAVDISRVNNNKDPMLAAQKLRDIAISYGADGGIMIMVIYLKGIFKPAEEFDSKKSRGSLADIDQLFNKKPLRPTPNKVFPRMDEVPPPTKGLITLVFTDIRNSTVLWEKHNGGMSSAIRTHNDLLRFWLRLCRGYEVKTEGDAFMCSFHTPMDAIWWTLRVQIELLGADWPRELLDTDECREIHDVEGKLIARGVSVRMGIHCGNPGCEPDPVTGRMDYFGPMVNRTARVNGQAAGGQIAISGDVLPELKACLELAPQTENTPDQPADAVAAVRALSPMIFSKGHFALKGIEQPEYITHIYPRELASRETIDIAAPPSLARVSTSTRPRIQFKPEQIRALGLVAVRLEAIAAQCVHKTSLMPNLLDPESLPAPGAYQTKDIELLIPILSSKATDQEVISVLDSLTGRINNATAAIMLANVHGAQELMQAVVTQGGVPDDKLQQIMAILNG